MTDLIVGIVVHSCLFLSSGCEVTDSNNRSALQELWRVGTGGIVSSQPAYYNGVIYVGSWDRKFYAINASSGQILWTYQTGGIIGGPRAEVSDTLVYFGSADYFYYAVNALTGKLAWKFNMNGGYADMYGARAVEDYLYVGSDESKLYAFDKHTGAVRWQDSVTGRPQGRPAISGDTLYFGTLKTPQAGTAEGYAYAINRRTGNVYWKTLLPKQGYFFGGSLTEGCLWGALFIIGSENSSVYALRRDSGMVQWTHKTSETILSHAVVDNSTIYIGSLDTYLYALDASTGGLRWKYKTRGSIEHGPASIEDQYVTFYSSDGFIYVLDKKTGADRFKWKSGSNPVLTNGVLYTGGYDDSKGTHFILAVKINS